MANPGNFSNNPLYTDITKLDHLSPQPVFAYNWNSGDNRWEPAGGGGAGGGSLDIGSLNALISGLSGIGGVGGGGTISGSLNLNDITVAISGLSSGISNLTGVTLETETSYRLITKTVNHKIEEDFILLENIPDDVRNGEYSGYCYGVDRFVMDDIYNTYYENARTNPSNPETGHPDYFIHAEYTDPNRCSEANGVFHSDTRFALRFDNQDASPINSYELKDFSQLYDSGLADSVVIFNESPYPIQFHTIDKTYDLDKIDDPENNNIMYLNADTAVTISSDEARRIYIKRPHTISGYTIKYNVIYRETGESDAFNR